MDGCWGPPSPPCEGWGFPVRMLWGRWGVLGGGAAAMGSSGPSAVGQDDQRWGSVTSGQEGPQGRQGSGGVCNQPCCITLTGVEDLINRQRGRTRPCPQHGGSVVPRCVLGVEGTSVTPWEVARAGTHPPGSTGYSSEQGPAPAVSGCQESRGARSHRAWLSRHCRHAGDGLCCLSLQRGCLGGVDPKMFPPITAPVKLKNLGRGAGH